MCRRHKAYSLAEVAASPLPEISTRWSGSFLAENFVSFREPEFPSQMIQSSWGWRIWAFCIFACFGGGTSVNHACVAVGKDHIIHISRNPRSLIQVPTVILLIEPTILSSRTAGILAIYFDVIECCVLDVWETNGQIHQQHYHSISKFYIPLLSTAFYVWNKSDQIDLQGVSRRVVTADQDDLTTIKSRAS